MLRMMSISWPDGGVAPTVDGEILGARTDKVCVPGGGYTTRRQRQIASLKLKILTVYGYNSPEICETRDEISEAPRTPAHVSSYSSAPSP